MELDKQIPLKHASIMTKYPVTLFHNEEGWAVTCPSLPGCWSQGESRKEALENIKEAIRLWVEVEAEEEGVHQVIHEEVAV